MRQSHRWGLKYLQGVRAVPTMRADKLIDQVLNVNSAVVNTPASRQFFYEDKQKAASSSSSWTSATSSTIAETNGGTDSSRHRLIQLRLGGAQMLASTNASIYNHNEGHPLFFAQTSPRQAGLCLPLVQALQRLRIHKLTELQGALIPILLKGKHVIAHAETGTGKSFGIALATVNRILRESVNHRLHTLIIVPTEELALQYDKWLRHFGGCASQIVQAAFESIPLESQLAKLHNVHPHVLVGTPQRIADIAKASPMILGEKLRRKVDCVIIDEADLILKAEVQYGREKITGAGLIDRLYRSRQDEVPAQMVATSATIDGATAQRLNAWMRNDKAVRLTTSFVEHTVPETISFYFFAASKQYPLPHCMQLSLQLIFRQCPKPKILIFTSHDVAALTAEINKMSFPEAGLVGKQKHHHQQSAQIAGSLHEEVSDPSNPNRIISASQLIGRNKEIYVQNGSNLSLLNSGQLPIGVGRFEICRGLHVSGVTHVIMYGEAPTTGDFVHCAGRTGRMGREGDVICLFPPQSGRAMMTICNAVEIPFTVMKIKHVEDMLAIESFSSHHHYEKPEQEEGVPNPETEDPINVESAKNALWAAQREELYHGTIRNAYVRERVLDEVRFGEMAMLMQQEEAEKDVAHNEESNSKRIRSSKSSVEGGGLISKEGSGKKGEDGVHTTAELEDDGNLAWSIMI